MAALLACSALGAAFVEPVAQAAQPSNDALPIAVLAVKSDEALDQAEALTGALRTAVLHSDGWSLGEATQALEFLALKMKCGDPIDAACEARIADVIKADRFLWSVLKYTDPSNKEVSGTLNLFVRGKGTNSTEVRFAATMTDATDEHLIAVANAALEKVTGGPPPGGIKVVSGGVAGQLYVDGKPIGALPAEGGTFQVPAGDHAVLVRAPGYQDATSNVHVQPLATVDAMVTMVPAAKETPIDGRMIGGFVSLGLGVASGGVGLWAALDVKKIKDDEGYGKYRDKLSSSQNACDVAKNAGVPGAGFNGIASDAQVQDLCSRANRDELIQAITFPLAAIAAGVGGYLLGTSSLGSGGSDKGATKGEPEEKPSAWMLQPEVGPYQQKMTFQYRF